MALIIKGDMPASCRWHNKQGKNTPIEVCPYFQNCSAEFNFEDYRPSDCPILGEIPNERLGKLKDIDAIAEMILKNGSFDAKQINVITRILIDAPTILEAST